MKRFLKILLTLLTLIIAIKFVHCEDVDETQLYQGDTTTNQIALNSSTTKNHEEFIEDNSSMNNSTFSKTKSKNNSIEVTNGFQIKTGRIKRADEIRGVRNSSSSSRISMTQRSFRHTTKPQRKIQNSDESEVWTRYLLLWS